MSEEPREKRAGWEPTRHPPLPRPTYFPAGLALGSALIFLGCITSWVILLAGAGLFASALAGWIAEIRHER